MNTAQRLAQWDREYCERFASAPAQPKPRNESPAQKEAREARSR